jgi:tetratricopeptide (TPR) repeat protein
MSRLVLMVLLVTGCYSAPLVRRERTTVGDDAKQVLAAALPRTDVIDHDAFDRHYNAAMESYRHADYARAIAEFEAAFAIDAQPMLIFNIAQSYRKAGRLDEALRNYRDYLQRDPSAEHGHVTELIEETQRDLAHKTTAEH